MKINDKRGWIRVLEVFLAILIVMGALLVGVSDLNSNQDSDIQIYEKQREILELINKNEGLRDDIIGGVNSNVNLFIEELIPNYWEFETKICKLKQNCSKPTAYYGDVYSTEIMIAASLRNNNPKKLRFFVWMEG